MLKKEAHLMKLKFVWKLSCFIFLFLTPSLFANPINGNVVVTSDHAPVHINTHANTLTIDQTTNQKVVIDWSDFSIDAGETTRFFQPNSNAVVLNRVTGLDRSEIFGNLTAQGNVWILNKAGVLFGQSAVVNVGGLLATTADISNADFMSGHYHFVQPEGYEDSKIINESPNVVMHDYGLAALVAPSVENCGVIQANLGRVLLASTTGGDAFTVDLYGDDLIHFAVNDSVRENRSTLVKNSGTIRANGGKVLLTAGAVNDLVNSVVNTQGVIEANAIGEQNGEITLFSGKHGVTQVSGTVQARGSHAGESGGGVKILGQHIEIGADDVEALIDASGQAAGGSVFIGKDEQVGSGISQSKTTYVGKNSSILANALDEGDGGEVRVWSDDHTEVYGKFEAKGGPTSGDGGVIETSGADIDFAGIQVNASAADGLAGKWIIDPADFYIDSTISGTISTTLNGGTDVIFPANTANNITFLTGAAVNWSTSNAFEVYANNNINFDSGATITNTDITVGGHLVLRADAEADGAGTVNFSGGTQVNFASSNGYVDLFYNPSGGYGSPDAYGTYISGTFYPYMLVNNIADLSSINTLNLGGDYALGADIEFDGSTLFTPIGDQDAAGYRFTGRFNGNGYVIRNLKVSYYDDPAGLFGTASAAHIINVGLENVDIGGNAYVGSLIGKSTNTTVDSCYSDGGQVVDNNIVGGLIGQSDTYSSITNSYSTVSVTGHDDVGGLVGVNNDSDINDSYSTGSVHGKGSHIGGLVGHNLNSPLSNVYATGDIVIGQVGSSTQRYDVGGLVGWNYNSPIDNAYATGSVQYVGFTSDYYDHVGGLIGRNGHSSIENAYATGSVKGDDSVGGLVGLNYDDSSIENAYATGSVAGDINVGGLVGWNSYSSIKNAYATGSVVGNFDVGGLVGWNDHSSIENAYATGAVTGNIDVGGFVGLNYYSSIENAYATGAVTGYDDVGGFVGWNYYYSSIENAYATGSVTGNSDVGGFVGWNNDYSSIENAYATGSVTGNSDVGGFVGSIDSTSSINDSFWDIDTSGKPASQGVGSGPIPTTLFGKHTADMMDYDNFNGVGWSIEKHDSTPNSAPASVWVILDDQTRPFLSMEYSTDITNSHQLQLMAADLDADYTLMNDINLSDLTDPAQMWGTSVTSGHGFVPIGNTSPYFTGSFDGQDHVISHLYINRPSTSYVGLFGVSKGGQIEHVGLEDVDIVGSDNVGSLVGRNDDSASIDTSYSIGSVKGHDGVGGLVGWNTYDSSIKTSYSIGSVEGYLNVGGLVGLNEQNSSISKSYSIGSVEGNLDVGGLVGLNVLYSSIDQSFSQSSVIGDQWVGGLVGGNTIESSIDNSYSLGAVLSGYMRGGLVGENATNSTITNCYSAAYVVGPATFVGGLVGADSGTVTNSFWDEDTSGLTSSSGGIGLSHEDMLKKNSFTGWGIPSSTWGIIENKSYPYLKWRYSTPPQVISGTAFEANQTTSIGGGRQIGLILDGNPLTTTYTHAYTGANGFYYNLFDSGTVANDQYLWSYIVSPDTLNANTLWYTDGGNITDLDLFKDTLIVRSDPSHTFSNSILKARASDLPVGDIVYTVGTSNNLSMVGSGQHFYTWDDTPYEINGDITTPGNQTFNGPVDLTVTPISLSSTSGDITFTDTVDGATALTLNATNGAIEFQNEVGGVTPLLSLTANGNTISLQDVTTTGSQTYNGVIKLNGDYQTSNSLFKVNGDAVLAGDTTVDTGTGAGDIEFTGFIDSWASNHSLDLKSGTGDINLQGVVGYLFPLSHLDATGYTIDLESVFTAGYQEYNGTTETKLDGTYNTHGGYFEIDSDTTLDGHTTILTDSGDVTFTGTIDATSSGLEIGDIFTSNLSGTVDLQGNVGDTHSLSYVKIAGDTVKLRDVTTEGEQYYYGATSTHLNGKYETNNSLFDIDAAGQTVLDGTTTILTNGGNVTFENSVTGNESLTIGSSSNYSGVVDLQQAVGDPVPLADLTIYGDQIILHDVTTNGLQNYKGSTSVRLDGHYETNGGDFTVESLNAILDGAVEVDTRNTIPGDITFTGAIDGPYGLTLIGNQIDLQGEIGGNDPLACFNVTGTTFLHEDVTTTGDQLYTGLTNLMNDITLSAILDGDIVFDGLASGPLYHLTLNSSLWGNATGTVDVKALTLQGGDRKADLWGFVDGGTSFIGAYKIALVEPIKINTHFFEGIDLYILKYVLYPSLIFPYHVQEFRAQEDPWYEDGRRMCRGLDRLRPECLKIEVEE
jgi:filamentous hemagglutinin family protein